MQDYHVYMSNIRENRWILGKEPGPIYRVIKQTLTCLLNSQDTEFYRDEDRFQWAQTDFMNMQEWSYILAEIGTYWICGKFPDNFPIYFGLCYSKIIYAALLALTILLIYRWDIAQPHTTPEQTFFPIPPFSLITDNHKTTATSIKTSATIGIVASFILSASICIWER